MGLRELSERYLSPHEAKHFYDRFGSKQDWQHFYENPAIDELIAHAHFESARSVLEFGCGTGSFAYHLLQGYLAQNAGYVGIDISSTMVSLTRERLKPWLARARVYQTDGSPHIAEPDHHFDRFVSTYVFDLLGPDFIEELLSEAHRVLVTAGKLCLVSLTFGNSRLSRAISCAWQELWRMNPTIVGGCRPVELSDYLPPERWNLDHEATVTSWGISSEVLVVSAK